MVSIKSEIKHHQIVKESGQTTANSVGGISMKRVICESIPNNTMKMGKWIKHEGWSDDDYGVEYSCEFCNEWVDTKSNYCPNCGARL